MKRIALTGGIGSGKSVVAKIFEMLGATIYNSDSRAKEIMESNEELIMTIKNTFGEDIYVDKKLNSKKLADIVFKDKTSLNKLNSIIHPVVIDDFDKWANSLTNTKCVILESAVIFDNYLQSHFDAVITVSAPIELRVQRTMERDGITREIVLERMAVQMNDFEREQRADHIIINNEKHSLWEQILSLNFEF